MEYTCRLCGLSFEITEQDLAFYDKISPVFNGKKYEIPSPTLCPDDRQRRRAAFRNERNLYRRKSDATGQEIISMFSPDKPFKVFESEYWWGDEWNPLDYGRDFDFSRSFFEQFRELQLKVPRLALFNYQSENSYYTNHAGKNRNCYMGFDLGDCEDVYYSNWVTYSKDCVDCSYTHYGELCYQCIYCVNCFNCDFCQECEQCSDLAFCFDCKGCRECFGCAGLRNKQHYVFNKSVSKEEYQKTIEQYAYSFDRQQAALENFLKFRVQASHRFARMVGSEGCSGDYIYNSKNALFCFDAVNLWDCKYCYNTLDTKNGYDCYQPGFEPNEFIYEVHAGNRISNSKFMHMCRNVNDCMYCDSCFDSHDLFGGVGIKRGSYCILNKQYSKEEYEDIVPRIIESMSGRSEWGEFFPMSCSPFGYNESKAQEYFPLVKEQAVKLGALWSDYKPAVPEGNVVSIPDDIRYVDDSSLGCVFICNLSGKAFKLVKQELEFYRKKKLPVPHYHPDVRYHERMKLRNPRKLWNRACVRCGKEIETTYAPDRPEKVYCEQCYGREVY